MNCEQANKIPLDGVIKKMGFFPLNKHSGGSETWYENPLRSERTPSFSVNHQKNLWQDLGTGEGGTVTDLVMQHNRTDVSGALRWLEASLNGTHHLPKISLPSSVKFLEKNPRFEIRKTQLITNPALKQYIDQRAISQTFAREHLREVRYLDTETQKEFFGLGMQNESGGWAIRNKYMKTVIAPNDFTHIKGNGSKGNVINVFEGMFDYLSYLEMTGNKHADMQSLILHSLNMSKNATAYLEKNITLSHVVLWFDNEPTNSKASEAVERATNYFTTLPYGIYNAQDTYRGFVDLNEAWVATKNLRIELHLIQPNGNNEDIHLEM